MDELSPADYKVHILKTRMANIVASYEDKIADYETTLQLLRQEIETLRLKDDDSDAYVDSKS